MAHTLQISNLSATKRTIIQKPMTATLFPNDENPEMHLDIYPNRSILYAHGEKQVFLEGPQDASTQKNVAKIKTALDGGFLERLIANVHTYDFSSLDRETRFLIDSIVAKVTSEVGRALVGQARRRKVAHRNRDQTVQLR